jgi:ankyrin repeat protein
MVISNTLLIFVAIGNASRNGHTDVMKLLLADSRVDPSANNNYGNIKHFIDICSHWSCI